jgi:hypothetical protein
MATQPDARAAALGCPGVRCDRYASCYKCYARVARSLPDAEKHSAAGGCVAEAREADPLGLRARAPSILTPLSTLLPGGAAAEGRRAAADGGGGGGWAVRRGLGEVEAVLRALVRAVEAQALGVAIDARTAGLLGASGLALQVRSRAAAYYRLEVRWSRAESAAGGDVRALGMLASAGASVGWFAGLYRCVTRVTPA